MRALVRPAAVAVACSVAFFLGACDDKRVDPEDNTPPEAEITEPEDGADVSGIGFPLRVDTNLDAVGVQVTVGDEEAFELGVSPFVTYILTVPYASGAQLPIVVRAFDAAGNVTERSATVTVAPRTLTQLTTDTQEDRNPTWSPDGTAIAFEANRGVATHDIWVMNDDGTNQTRLTFDTNDDFRPAWSPDGTSIAWESNRSGTFDLWWMPVATGEVDAENLTFPNGDNREPAWTFDGDRIYFSSNRGGGAWNIWRIDPVTKSTIQVTSRTADERQPAANLDGRFLAFSTPLNFTEPHVYLLEVGLNEVTAMTGEAGVSETDPHLSPLENVALYTRTASSVGNIWAIYRDRGTAVQITNALSVPGDGGAEWSPAGDRIVFHSNRTGNSDIWLLE